MTILPHLPAPVAIYDPWYALDAYSAPTPPRRVDPQAPVAAERGGRSPRAVTRPVWDQTTDQGDAQPRSSTRYPYGDPRRPARLATDLFFVQRYAQEDSPPQRPAVAHGVAAAAYPSLSFENDIWLPGEAIPMDRNDRPRLDIVV